MRVISGKWGGRTIQTPKGKDTRPTTDRVKESMMSAIESAQGFEDMCVLDAYAGSGGLGIEALSRGASFVTFCDHAASAKAIIQANLKSLKADNSAYEVFNGDISRFVQLKALESGSAYDIVILDPPYALEPEKVLQLLTALDDASLLAKETLICYEHSKTLSAQQLKAYEQAGYTWYKHKKMGDIQFDLLWRERL